MKLEVVVVDDHEMVRDGLVRLLTIQGRYKVIASLESAEALYESLKEHLPDIIIMDLSMPGMGGAEAVKRMLLKWPTLKIIIFSIYKNQRLAQHLFKLGAKAYVTKSSKSAVVVEAIDKVMAGGRFVSPDLAIDISEVDVDKDALASLSAKEFDILCFIGEGLSTQQISEKMFLSSKTIANNLSIIKKKLNVNTTTKLIHLAIKEGLVIVDF
jgi:DNA-binding NarL/FixJ family response regulator